MKKNILTTTLVICAGIIMAASVIIIPVLIFAYVVFLLPMLK